MIWTLLAALVVVTHVVAIVLGRPTQDRFQRIAFGSELAGLFSFPVVFYFAIKSFCIAGACRHVDTTGLYLSLAVFALLATVSLLSAAGLVVRRLRA
ncbi:hypothetical protein [Lysobacter sp. A289]